MKLLLCDLIHTASRTANYWVLLRHNMNFYQWGLTRRRSVQKLTGEVWIVASHAFKAHDGAQRQALEEETHGGAVLVPEVVGDQLEQAGGNF